MVMFLLWHAREEMLSIRHILSQAPGDGGLGWGTTATSAVFLITIAVLVSYLTFATRRTIAKDYE